jgi:hypothetical protein
MSRRVIVIGAGISGISNALHLRKNGYQVTLLERSTRIGGIWTNGVANSTSNLQTPSFFYRFSPQVHWNCQYPATKEIVAQIDGLDISGINLKLNQEVISLTKRNNEFLVETSGGDEYVADGVIVAIGLHFTPKVNPFKLSAECTIKIYLFNEIDRIDPYGKRCLIVGLGAGALECHRTLLSKKALSVDFVSRGVRWIFPNNFLYAMMAFLPLARPGQFFDRLVHVILKRYYHCYGLNDILPGCSPARTAPGGISSSFFSAVKKSKPKFYIGTDILEASDGSVSLQNGQKIVGVDLIVFCTGWEDNSFSFIKDRLISDNLTRCRQLGYLYLHEIVPGENSLIFSNLKTGIGYTGFAPFVSSMLLQCSLEGVQFTSEREQWKWIESECRKWMGAPQVFQFINMFESIKAVSIFFMSIKRSGWFLKKLLKRKS